MKETHTLQNSVVSMTNVEELGQGISLASNMSLFLATFMAEDSNSSMASIKQGGLISDAW